MRTLLLLFICCTLSRLCEAQADTAPRPGKLARTERATATGMRKYISPKTDSGYYLGPPEIYSYRPGDTIVLRSGDAWTYFTVDNFRGEGSRPLVIINEGGPVKMRHGIRLVNDSYIKLTGTGSTDRYGFFIEQDPVFRPLDGGALQIGRRSRNIDLGNVYVHNCAMGFVCETNADCADSLNYPNWVIDSISIHDCRIVGTWNEGMYIGNTSPDNAADSYDPRPVVCDGKKIYPMPMRNGNIRVYNNYVDSTGRGGIQLASASTGMSEIWQNIVKHNGMNGDEAQGTGISAGAYSHVYIHDNTITDTYTWGIASLGASGTGTILRIEHNNIDSSGYLAHYHLTNTEKYKMDPGTEPSYPDELKWPYPIELGTRPTLFTDSTRFHISNNTVGLFKSTIAAIQVHDEYQTITRSGNLICGNKNAADGTPATIDISHSRKLVTYEDCSGTVHSASRLIRYIRRYKKWIIALGLLAAIAAGLGYFIARGRRSRSPLP